MSQKQEVGLAADVPASYVPSVSSNLMSEVTDRGIKVCSLMRQNYMVHKMKENRSGLS